MHCPVCRAEFEAAPACRRCRADLGLLFTMETERGQLLARARRHAASGEVNRALAAAGRAHMLRRGPDSQQLLAVGHLLRRDFAAAWHAYTHRLS